MSLIDLANLAGLNGVGMAFFLPLMGEVISLEDTPASCLGLSEEVGGITKGK